ncbi:MAG: hypothetical protein KC964_23280, partial [Candidatus Omnitrophica bacterium]|nr:hypothetical protein [Candidatus Omnitrophota bacterium]
TVIGFSQEVLAQFPEFADVRITVPADSLYSDDGTRGGMVGIAPVPPDRIPGKLPEDLKFPLVITVQTNGPTNFDIPVPVCFPNMPDPETHQPLPPGAKSALWSFNHDTGDFEIQGSMTVSDDGTLICTDPGVGVTAPGWHGTQPGSEGDGGDADEQCQGSPKGDGRAEEKAQAPTFGPISLVGHFRGGYTFSVPQPSEPGTIDWAFSPDPVSVQTDTGLMGSVIFCTPGPKQIQATFSPSCGSGGSAIFSTVEVPEDEFGDTQPNISVQPGLILEGDVITFDSGLSQEVNGSVTWTFQGALDFRVFRRTSSQAGKAEAVWCNPGTYAVSVEFEDACGMHKTDSTMVTVSPGLGLCSQFLINYSVVEPPEARIITQPITILGSSGGLNDLPLARLRILAPGAQTPEIVDLASTYDEFFFGFGPWTLRYFAPGQKTVTIEAESLCGAGGVCTKTVTFEVMDIPIEPLSPPKNNPTPDNSETKLGDGVSSDDFQNQDVAQKFEEILLAGIDDWDSKQVSIRQKVQGPLYFAAENLSNGFVTRGQGGSEGVVHIRSLRL